MRIQNNIMAMNTHRQYTINNDNVSKSAEKLSSGYRINRAGDDAAGLAISEKMRSQIRGLNMATKNSQDAISLVQTAEGALQETHSMLQRMNELAVQAATGTNEDLDRNALAKEFDQLKREINDIAEQTTFNNMKVLDGSLSYSGPERSAATAGINNTVTAMEAAAGDAITSEITTAGVKGSAAVTAEAGKLEFDLAGMVAAPDAAGTDTISFDLTLGDGTKVTLTSQALATGDTADAAIAGKFANQTVQIDGETYTATVTGTKITLTAGNTGATDLGTVTMGNATLTGAGSVTTQPTASTVTVTEGKDAAAAVTAVAQVETATVDPTKIKYGDTITIGDKTYEITKDGTASGAGNTAITWKGDGTDDLGALLAAADAPTDLVIAAGADGTSFTVTQATGKEGDPAVDTKVTFAAGDGSNDKNTIEFDVVKMKAGDTVKLTVDGTEYSYEFKEGDKAADIAKGLVAADGTALGIDAKGNAIIIEGAKVEIGFEGAAVADDAFNAIRIQVGALEGEQLAVSIDSMNTAGLKLDDQNLNTQDSAGSAITAVRDAINKVSDQRATLGAMQNRLDHKIANLKVSSENLSAAESRIRDVDMASEMTTFTKNNILSQAATAMLAQANALPQNVLTLLR
ncbi:flagellin N-terminal helical domain-containing protein [Christensenella tenuis]|jgi:flagellin|nr:flagellin [Christensenella tenuis]